MASLPPAAALEDRRTLLKHILQVLQRTAGVQTTCQAGWGELGGSQAACTGDLRAWEPGGGRKRVGALVLAAPTRPLRPPPPLPVAARAAQRLLTVPPALPPHRRPYFHHPPFFSLGPCPPAPPAGPQGPRPHGAAAGGVQRLR